MEKNYIKSYANWLNIFQNIPHALQAKEFSEDFIASDRFMLKIIFINWFIVSFLSSIPYQTYLFGFVSGGILSLVAFFLYKSFRGEPFFRNSIAVILMMFSVILIQQSFGRIEFHFHIFIALSFLTVYKDIKPLTFASVFIALHHLGFNYLQSAGIEFFGMPIIVFNYGCGLDIVFLHAIFVLFEWIVLLKVILNSMESFLQIIKSKQILIEINENLENRVQERTKDLQEAKDEALRANKVKSEFLANISHEIRTPMNAITGFAELLCSTLKEPINKGYANSILAAGKSLLGIINDILDLSKVEAGKLIIQKQSIDIRKIGAEIKDIFGIKIKQKKIFLSVNIDENFPLAVVADEIRIRQILINLISNGIKFTHEGGISLNIFMQINKDDDSKIDINFDVIDTGIGIAQNEQQRIFEAFTQTQGQLTREYGGTGLGLAICEKLAKLMNGEIELESVEGRGSKFSLKLYGVAIGLGLSDDGDKEEIGILKNLKFKEAKILVADDIDVNRELLREFLKHYPIKIVEASNGKEALEKLDETFNAVVIDIRMPVMDGFEAAKKIKEDTRFSHIQIIALSASIFKTNEEESRLAECFDLYLAKPISKKELIVNLAKILPSNLEELNYATFDTQVTDRFKVVFVQKFLETFRALFEDGDMGRLADFADEIADYGIKNNLEGFVGIANEIKESADGFDIEHMEMILKKFEAVKM